MKPKKFISTLSITLYTQVDFNEFQRQWVFKLLDTGLDETVYAAESQEAFKEWVDAFQRVKEEN